MNMRFDTGYGISTASISVQHRRTERLHYTKAQIKDDLLEPQRYTRGPELDGPIV